jgi:hypothetical protein
MCEDEYLLPIEMSGDELNFINQRADKISVHDILEGEEDDHEIVINKNGILRAIDEYTMTCPDCGGDGYYDDRGEVICEDCGVVISGGQDAVVPLEHNPDADSLGSSRGLEKMPGSRNSRGTREPRI